MGKIRIDQWLVEQGYYDSIKKAQSAIMAGIVYVDDVRIETAGTTVSQQAELTVKAAQHPYVSRGGLKLEKALRFFNIDVTGRVMIDVGASTGGFSDCALQHGASYIYAIDVGYNQLAWAIRNSPQVKVMERTNFRYVKPGDLKGPEPDFATIDVSFISLRLILPVLKELLTKQSEIIALIKPQFEAPKHKVGPSGIVTDAAVHRLVLEQVIAYGQEAGFSLHGLTHSPITGGQGNIEFLAYWTLDADKRQQEQCMGNTYINDVVVEAHRTLLS